jgi:hypothetical protein
VDVNICGVRKEMRIVGRDSTIVASVRKEVISNRQSEKAVRVRKPEVFHSGEKTFI